MIRIGELNELTAVRTAPPGTFLTDGETEILLPNKLVPPTLEIGGLIEVFVYTDSEDRPVATTQRPLAKVGEFAYLRCIGTSRAGAFLDWGLDKDLFLPFGEMRGPIQEGESTVVRVYLDRESNRVAASSKLNRFVEDDTSSLKVGDPVTVLVYRKIPNGVKVIVSNRWDGTIFSDEIHGPLRQGDRRAGYVKKIGEHGLLSVTLQIEGYRAAKEQAPNVLEKLEAAGGFLPFNDDTEPDVIRREFGMSKGTFKKTIGNLFRQGFIEITDDGIQRVRRRS